MADGEVVDETPRMLVVEAHSEHVAELVEELADWVVAPDHNYPVPDTRRRIERPPGWQHD